MTFPVSRLVCASAVIALVSCNSGSSVVMPQAPTAPTVVTPPAPTNPTPAPPAPTLSATIVITSSNTFQPPEVTVLVGGRVTFINQNNRAHDITSDPPHLHTDCPPVIEVGFIQPGQTKVSGPLTVARTCGVHDHMQENNPDLRAKITIQEAS